MATWEDFYPAILFTFMIFECILSESSPDDHDYAIKDVVGVLDVAKGPVNQNLEQHLQGEETGEHNVADLQGIGQPFRLERPK